MPHGLRTRKPTAAGYEASGSALEGTVQEVFEGDAEEDVMDVDVEEDREFVPTKPKKAKTAKTKRSPPKKKSALAAGTTQPQASVSAPTHGRSRPVLPQNQSVSTSTQLGKPLKRNNYALPTPSHQHRHRAIPLYLREGKRLERMVVRQGDAAPEAESIPPSLFQHPPLQIVDYPRPKVQERIAKACGYNVGHGPLWELLEDRSWFKESEKPEYVRPGSADVDSESRRRPIVHGNIQVKSGWRMLDMR